MSDDPFGGSGTRLSIPIRDFTCITLAVSCSRLNPDKDLTWRYWMGVMYLDDTIHFIAFSDNVVK
jgi:hypothetical protein